MALAGVILFVLAPAVAFWGRSEPVRPAGRSAEGPRAVTQCAIVYDANDQVDPHVARGFCELFDKRGEVLRGGESPGDTRLIPRAGADRAELLRLARHCQVGHTEITVEAVPPGDQPNVAEPEPRPIIAILDEAALESIEPENRPQRLVYLWKEFGCLLVSPAIDREFNSLSAEKTTDQASPAAPHTTSPAQPDLRRLIQVLSAKPKDRHGAHWRIDLGPEGSLERQVGLVLLASVLDQVRLVEQSPEAAQKDPSAQAAGNHANQPPQADVVLRIARLQDDEVRGLLRVGYRLVAIQLPEHAAGNSGKEKSLPGGLQRSQAGNPGEVVMVSEAEFSRPRLQNQSQAEADRIVVTFSTRKWLVAGSRLGEPQAQRLVDSVFSPFRGQLGTEVVLRHHAAAEDILLEASLETWRNGKERAAYHPGARAAWDRQNRARSPLSIYCGPAGSTSFRMGQELAEILKAENYPHDARVISTAGSQSSLDRLREAPGRSLAIVSGDAANTAYSDTRDLRLITRLYTEAVQLVVADWDQRDEEYSCQCRPSGEQPSSLIELIDSIVRYPERFAVQDDTASFRRDYGLLRFFSMVAGQPLPELVAEKDRHKFTPIQQLSLVQIQERLMRGELVGALVSSAVPMPLINQMINPAYPRFKPERLEGLRCPWCELPLKGRPRLQILTLDHEPDAKDTNAEAVPSRLKGYVARSSTSIPLFLNAYTYADAQVQPVHTVGVDVVLACHEQFAPSIASLLGVMLDNQIRLRSVVRSLDLRSPLGGQSTEASLPLSSAARKFFEEKGMLAPLPKANTVFSRENFDRLLWTVLGVAVTIFFPRNWRSLTQKWLFGWTAREKLRREFEEKLARVYYDSDPARWKLHRMTEVQQEVYAARRAGTIDPLRAEELDRTIREYKERIQKDAEIESKTETKSRAG